MGLAESAVFPLGALIVVGAVVALVTAAVRQDEPVTSRRWSGPYYYAAALIGLVMVLFGLVGGLYGLVQAALPQTSDQVLYSADPYAYGPDGEVEEMSEHEQDERRQRALDDARAIGVADALRGGITAAVGAPVLLWHLRQARRREADEAVAAPRPAAAP